jgi:hypothetical protein
MAMQLPTAAGDARSEPPTWTALVLEMVALRHQIAVLKRSGTRRPCFRFHDRLFWLLLARWWPGWRDSLVIVQPATVLDWRSTGWSGLWRYRSRGRWRGGRPRISREIRQLIVRMARENFLWGAPRIHGELLMLGFTVSQATVSRYMPPANRRPGQSWRTFLRNQAMAFGHREYAEEWSRVAARLPIESNWTHLKRSGTAWLMAVCFGLKRGPAQQPTHNEIRISPRYAYCDRGVTRCSATASGGSRTLLHQRSTRAFPLRSPPRQARGYDCRGFWPTQDVASVERPAGIHRASSRQGGRRTTSYETSRSREILRVSAHG